VWYESSCELRYTVNCPPDRVGEYGWTSKRWLDLPGRTYHARGFLANHVAVDVDIAHLGARGHGLGTAGDAGLLAPHEAVAQGVDLVKRLRGATGSSAGSTTDAGPQMSGELFF